MSSVAPKYVWYVSGFNQPWETDVISNLAEALKNKGVSLRVYAQGGTAHLNVENVMSWNSLTFFERVKAVFSGRKLWHLWGDAPLWWGLVRVRSRTVHTSLCTNPQWKGHPTRLFKEQARQGENRVQPTFEPKAAWADFSHSNTHSQLNDEWDEPVLIPAWNDAGTCSVIIESWAYLVAKTGDECSKRSRILVVDDTPSNALQAAYMTMRGVPVVAKDAPLIRETLGAEGYVAAPSSNDKAEWEKALSTAASDVGRSVSAAARYFLKENYPAAAAAESLENLYEAVGRGC